jgi:hypothetical protein
VSRRQFITVLKFKIGLLKSSNWPPEQFQEIEVKATKKTLERLLFPAEDKR